MEAPASEPVQSVATLASALNHLKNNRLEYLLMTILMYSTGLGATLLTQAQGVCV
jgi:hypothetical protein